MSSLPFIGEIKLFGGNFEIRGYAFCAGQVLSISQYTALFALIGTIYGGDGQTTFALPDLRGRIPIGQGNGSGLTPKIIGQMSGTENVTLLVSQLPAHTHNMNCNAATANSGNPAGNFPASQPQLAPYAAASTPASTMKSNMVGNTGGTQPHPNQQPYLTINYLIALDGLFPSQN